MNSEAEADMHAPRCILKRLRKGAFECGPFLVLRTHWISERWDGPQDRFLEWKVYAPGSRIEKRMLLDSFGTLKEAYVFVSQRMAAVGQVTNRGQ